MSLNGGFPMITLSQRRAVAGDFEPEPQARELTAAELDHVAGGILPAVVVVVVVVAAAVQKLEDASGSDDKESDTEGGEG